MKKYEILNRLKELNNVCVISHLAPDADAFASLNLTENFLHFLRVKNVDLFTELTGEIEQFNFLFDLSSINLVAKSYDAVILLDCANSERAGVYVNLFKETKLKIVIDHHITNTLEGDINIVENVSSTVEVLYKILAEFNYPFTKNDYTNIYAGIITDTGNFSVGEITADSFRIVAECFEQKIDYKMVYNRLCATTTLSSLKALALAVDNIKSYENGKILITHISKDEENQTNLQDQDYEGVINKLAEINNCEMVAFIKPRNNKYYISMRSRGYDISTIAINNNGGGHRCASAYWSDDTIDTIENYLLTAFKLLLDKNS